MISTGTVPNQRSKLHPVSNCCEDGKQAQWWSGGRGGTFDGWKSWWKVNEAQLHYCVCVFGEKLHWISFRIAESWTTKPELLSRFDPRFLHDCRVCSATFSWRRWKGAKEAGWCSLEWCRPCSRFPGTPGVLLEKLQVWSLLLEGWASSGLQDVQAHFHLISRLNWCVQMTGCPFSETWKPLTEEQWSVRNRVTRDRWPAPCLLPVVHT